MFHGWPGVTLRVVACSGDRFSPLELQRRVAKARLNKDIETLPGGHLVAQPCGLNRAAFSFSSRKIADDALPVQWQLWTRRRLVMRNPHHGGVARRIRVGPVDVHRVHGEDARRATIVDTCEGAAGASYGTRNDLAGVARAASWERSIVIYGINSGAERSDAVEAAKALLHTRRNEGLPHRPRRRGIELSKARALDAFGGRIELTPAARL